MRRYVSGTILQFGTNDFTVEFVPTDTVQTANASHAAVGGGSVAAPTIYTLSNGTIAYFHTGADRITPVHGHGDDWRHRAITRQRNDAAIREWKSGRKQLRRQHGYNVTRAWVRLYIRRNKLTLITTR
jgi:hypothetical protein